MAERKVQNKYIPADYDPKVLQYLTKKAKRESGGDRNKSNKLEASRIMLPFNVCCEQCGAYMYRGRKFNAGKEVGVDPDYMGTKIIRFHFKCENCSSEIVFRTNPQSSGFDIVSGARENVTSVGRFNALEGVEEKNEGEEQQPDALAMLEKRAMESKKEMAVVDELETALQRSEARSKALMGGGPLVATSSSSSSSALNVQQQEHDDDDDDDDDRERARQVFARKRMLDSDAQVDVLGFKSSRDSFSASLDVPFKRIQVVSKTHASSSADVKTSQQPTTTSLVPYDDDD